MPGKRFTPEQIIATLREAEVLSSRGHRVPEMCKQLNISEHTYYRWRKESVVECYLEKGCPKGCYMETI